MAAMSAAATNSTAAAMSVCLSVFCPVSLLPRLHRAFLPDEPNCRSPFNNAPPPIQAPALPAVECFPVPIMKWSEGFFSGVFSHYGEFRLAEHGAGTSINRCC